VSTTYPRLAGAALVIAGLWIMQAAIQRGLADFPAGQEFRHDASCDRARIANPPAAVRADGLCRLEALSFTERYRSPDNRTWILIARDTAGGTQQVPLSTGRRSSELAGSLRPGDRLRVLWYRGVAPPAEIIGVASGRTVVKAGHPPDVAFWFDVARTLAGLVIFWGGSYWLRTGLWHPPLPTTPHAPAIGARA
jgi:hypothetical protein